MQVRHPEALEGVGGECPDRVSVGGDTHECSGGEPFDVSERVAAALADRYGVAVEDIAVGEGTDSTPTDGDESGTCDVIKGDGEVCGRERPCPYHDD